MAKSMILNRFNGKTNTIYVPADASTAGAFASALLDGEYQVLSLDTELGNDTETAYQEVQVMVKNSTTQDKTYVNMKCKTNKSEDEIFTVLKGLTINGIHIDECYMMAQRLVNL